LLILSPETVTLGTITLDRVVAFTVDRAATVMAEHWSDLGPFQVYADAAEQRVVFTIVQELRESRDGWIKPGDLTSLAVRFGPTAGDQGRRTLTCAAAVVESVRHELGRQRGGGGAFSAAAAAREARRIIKLIGLSSDGQNDVFALDPL